MKSTLVMFLFAIIAGVLLPIQAALNAKMGKAVSDPSYGALVSFVVGGLGIVLYMLIMRIDFSTITEAKTVHWSAWTPGLMGAFYVIATIVLVPKLGPTMTFGLVIAGQLLVSLIMDHYGWLGVPITPINWQRVFAVAMVFGGLLLFRSA